MFRVNHIWPVTYCILKDKETKRFTLDMLKISDWKEPFSLRNGWLLWAGIGIVGAIFAIALAGTALTIFNGEQPQREVRCNLCMTLMFILYLYVDKWWWFHHHLLNLAQWLLFKDIYIYWVFVYCCVVELMASF